MSVLSLVWWPDINMLHTNNRNCLPTIKRLSPFRFRINCASDTIPGLGFTLHVTWTQRGKHKEEKMCWKNYIHTGFEIAFIEVKPPCRTRAQVEDQKCAQKFGCKTQSKYTTPKTQAWLFTRILQLGNYKVWRFGAASCGLGQRPVANSCGHGNGPSGPIKGSEFLV
jgi:hypothetical protein